MKPSNLIFTLFSISLTNVYNFCLPVKVSFLFHTNSAFCLFIGLFVVIFHQLLREHASLIYTVIWKRSYRFTGHTWNGLLSMYSMETALFSNSPGVVSFASGLKMLSSDILLLPAKPWALGLKLKIAWQNKISIFIMKKINCSWFQLFSHL